jgi:hypothetical protein
MSVTFTVHMEVISWGLACSCGDVMAVSRYSSYEDAVDALRVGVTPKCGDEFCGAYCASAVPVLEGEEAPQVNMSNLNAREVLPLLGLDAEDECGSKDGQDMLGRVLMAQAAGVPDAGRPAVQTGNMIDCGRAEGYFDDRLVELEAIALFAVKHQLPVTWS